MIPFLSSWGRASKGPPFPVPIHEAWCMAQQRWQLASAASTPPLPRVRSIGMPVVPLVPSFFLRHSRLTSHAGTLRLPPTLFISRFHVKHTPSHRVGIATAPIGLRCPVRAVNLIRQCRGTAYPIRLKESGNLLHSSVPSDDTRLIQSRALQNSVLRVGACMRSHVVFIARQRAGSSPGKGSEYPVPVRQYEPCEHWRYFHRLNQNENDPSATRCSFHVKPPQHKRIAHEACPV